MGMRLGELTGQVVKDVTLVYNNLNDSLMLTVHMRDGTKHDSVVWLPINGGRA